MSGEARPCPLCGGIEARVVLDAGSPAIGDGHYRVVCCAGCGLQYTRPLPTSQELGALYSQDYYVTNDPKPLSGDTLRQLFQRSVLWQHRRAFLGRQPGRVLDVGCGNGDFAASLLDRGWEVYGTDFSEAACTLARAKGVTTHQGDLATISYPDRFFDVVTLWHVLEHLPEPLLELSEIRRILRDDGLLIVEVPNMACLTSHLCREHWSNLDVPRHLQHFTASSLRRLLRKGGFDQVARTDFHHWDFTFDFYSVMRRFDIADRLDIRYFSTDFKQARLPRKLAFLALGVTVGAVCLPYSIITTVLTGNGETITVTARKGEA